MAPSKRRPPTPLQPGHMTLPPGLVEQYRADLRTVTDAGKARLGSALQSQDFDPEVDRHRTYVMISSTLSAYVDTYAEAIATRAAQFFDDVAKAQGVNVRKARPVVDVDKAATDVACKAICKAKTKDAAINLALNRFDYEMRRVANYSIYISGWDAEDELDANDSSIDDAERRRRQYRREKRRKLVRFARVPSGSETCAFCITLASRGFVYHSRAKAGLGRADHAHAHCDCVIVPSFLGEGMLAVAGYDPEALYRQYQDTSFYQ